MFQNLAKDKNLVRVNQILEWDFIVQFKELNNLNSDDIEEIVQKISIRQDKMLTKTEFADFVAYLSKFEQSKKHSIEDILDFENVITI
jgi:hypothetical protein